MATEPLGNMFITVTFQMDKNGEKALLRDIQITTKKISKKMKQEISKDVASGIKDGAEQGEKAIKGRLGFGGAGAFSPFRPEVMLAYTGARYMHMLLTKFLFNPVEDTISYYFNRKKVGFEKEGVKPTEDTLKELQAMRDVIPSITAKLGLFLQEVTKGTKIEAVDIVDELKKMINQGKAKDATEAFQKYRDILTLSEASRERALAEFGGSSSIAENIRYGNVTPNLLNYLNKQDFEKYAMSFERILKMLEEKEKAKLSGKAEVLGYGLMGMVEQDFKNKITKELAEINRSNWLALQYPSSMQYPFRNIDWHGILDKNMTLKERMRKDTPKDIFEEGIDADTRAKRYKSVYKQVHGFEPDDPRDSMGGEIMRKIWEALKELVTLRKKEDTRQDFHDETT